MDEVRDNLTARPPDPAAPHSAEEVFHEYAPRVYNLARRMLNSDADAEDVTQDVLLQVVRKLPSFRGESAFPTWLHRVTVNAALAHRRRRAVHYEHRVKAPLDMVLEEPADGPVRRYSRARLRRRALPTTDSELRLMAAPAHTGVTRPSAASGTASTNTSR